MVRRVIGASAAPTPDFSPFRAVTPAGGLTDFYRQPGTMAIPESEFSQVAQALQSISPTLSKVIGDTTEAANQAQADQGRMDAEKLTAEQKRDAMRGEFTLMEMSGAIPKGASPFRLAAMQAALGKDLIENELRTELNNPATINRLTDPLKKEDPAKLVSDLFAEKTKSLGFYAQGAATDALDAVETAFLNKVSLLKGEKTVAKNREDFANSVFNKLSDNDLTLMEKVAEVQKRLDEHYKVTGESGVTEVLNGLRAAAMGLAKEGKGAEAFLIIEQMRGLSIGNTNLGERSSMDLQRLEESVDSAETSAESKELQDLQNALTRRSLAAKTAADRLYSSMPVDDFRAKDFDADKAELITSLQEEEGLSEEDANLAVTDLIQELRRSQNAVPLSDEAAEQISNVIYDDEKTTAQKLQVLREFRGQIGDREYGSYIDYINKERGVNRTYRSLLGLTQGKTARMSRNLRDTLVEELYEGTEIELVLDGFENRIQTIVRDIAKQGGTDPEMEARFQEQANALRQTLIEEIRKPFDKEISDESTDIGRAAQQARRRRLLVGEDEPRAIQAETEPFRFDSNATIRLETLQSKDSSPEDRDEAKQTVYKDSLKAIDELKVESQRRRVVYSGGFRLVTQGMSDDIKRQELPLRAVVGFTLEEIKNKKTELGTDIPDKVLNPKHVVLIPNMRSADMLQIYAETEEGQRVIIEVMSSLPAAFRTGSSEEALKNFVELQMKVLERYRPNKSQG